MIQIIDFILAENYYKTYVEGRWSVCFAALSVSSADIMATLICPGGKRPTAWIRDVTNASSKTGPPRRRK